MHAVSVGEIQSSIELIRRLRESYPAAPVYVSVATVAARALADEKLTGVAAGIFYAPIDYRWCVRRVLRAIRPALVVILETEIWPNLYREVKRTGAALVVVNGRISDRAFPRYRRLRFFFRAALAQPDRILVQTGRDRDRYVSAGAPPERVFVGGKLQAAGVPFVRRSKIGVDTRVPLPGVLLLDTIGELSRVFASADVVFMGGTLARRGGHNVLEPAYFGKPVIIGPHMENFSEIADEFLDAGAVRPISGQRELADAVLDLLAGVAERERIGETARRLAESKRGVTASITTLLQEFYFRSLPCRPFSVFSAPFGWIWSRIVAADRSRRTRRRRRLERRVISIGNLSMGGAGKTPMTAWFAAELRSRAMHPAILTRGYRRRSPEPSVIVPAGSTAHLDVTGDEAQIFIREANAHVGIGSDRYATGRLALKTVAPDIFILDDAFQHWPLHRDVDVVLIDALDPFGGCRVFPAGRLREPLSALARADAFVITRAEPGFRTDEIESRLRLWNARAPVFRSRVVPRRWIELRTGQGYTMSDAPFGSAVAFCGLANPAAFWRTLDTLALQVRSRWAFRDHHVYSPRELRILARRAQRVKAGALVATKKDAMNLPRDYLEAADPVPVYYLEIGIEVEDSDRLIRLCLGG